LFLAQEVSFVPLNFRCDVFLFVRDLACGFRPSFVFLCPKLFGCCLLSNPSSPKEFTRFIYVFQRFLRDHCDFDLFLCLFFFASLVLVCGVFLLDFGDPDQVDELPHQHIEV
jgi:hypothetical protein